MAAVSLSKTLNKPEMRQLTLNFDGYAPLGGAAVSVGREPAQNVRTISGNVLTNIEKVWTRCRSAVRTACAVTGIMAGLLLATGADTVSQALAALAAFTVGAYGAGAFDRKGGAL